MPQYRHTQVGWKVYGALVPASVILIAIFVTRDGQTLGVLMAILALTLGLFGWLTVDINARRLLIQFGPGLIRRSISLDTIRGFAAVTNRWYYGWGIRLTPHGILYNVSGLQAVELLLDDGRRVRIGTDEPEALVRALHAATAITPSNTVDEFPKDVSWRRRVRLVAAFIGIATAVFVVGQVYVHSRAPTVELTDRTFAVRVALYGTAMPFAEIEHVELVDALPAIQRRTNGYAAGGLLRGHFRLAQWGNGQLFINRDVPPYLVVRSRDTFVVVNFEDPARTRQVYERLSAANTK
jgi:hypothetical protein